MAEGERGSADGAVKERRCYGNRREKDFVSAVFSFS